jgi:predicted enzyme related to lactoylglutathione lyase
MPNAEADRKIDYIEFAATDLRAVKRFYSEAFGWKFTDYGEHYTAFEDGRISGGFHDAAPVVAGGPIVVMYAVDLPASLAKVKAAGGEIVKEIFSFPGGRRFHFADPSGNVLAVWSDDVVEQ